MKKILLAGAALCFASISQATLIDDFSGDLSNYTFTTMLSNSGGVNDTIAQINSGKLEFETTTYGNIDQSAFIYNGLSLAVGEEVQSDMAWTSSATNQSFLGLYVGKTPVAGTRENYITVYMESATKIKTRGFNGTSELNNIFVSRTGIAKMFIARIAATDWEIGYYNGSDERFVIATRGGMNAGIDGSAVGFYLDARSVGILSELDNLTVDLIPEPPAPIIVPIVYQDDFSGGTNALNGIMPDTTINSNVWSAAGMFTADGMITNATGSAILPFEPRTGTVYRLETRIKNDTTAWMAVGFRQTDQVTKTFVNDGWAWMLSRNDPERDAQQAFAGSATKNKAFSGDLADPTVAIDVVILLDTTGGEDGTDAWTVTYELNGTDQGTYALDNAVKTGIHYVGFSRFSDGTGGSATIENFALRDTTAPSGAATIIDIAAVPGNLLEVTINAPFPSSSFPVRKLSLVSETWERVPHSDDGVNAFIEANLDYATPSGTNVVIYIQGDADSAFFSTADE